MGVDMTTQTFENFVPSTISIDRTKVLSFNMALGVKLKCFYERPNGTAGDSKRKSDLADAVFIIAKVKSIQGLEVSDRTSRRRVPHWPLPRGPG